MTYDDLLHQKIVFRNEDLKVDKEFWETVACSAIPQIEDLTGGHMIWEDGVNGIVQLMLLMVVGEIMKKD